MGNIGVAKSGIGFPDAEQGGTEGIPFYKVSDMNTKGNEHELVIAKNYVTQEQIAKKKWNVIEDVPAIFFAKVGAAVMLNRKRLVRFPFLLDNNTMAYIFDKNVWDYNFGKTLFETIDLTKLTQVGALPSYNASDVEGVKISIPNKQEQEQIGGYFSSLDNLITLHQRECDQLKELKKSMLKKMFPRDESSIPEVRFAGFTDAWEQRKFSDLYVKVNEKNDLSFGTDKIISVANMYYKEDVKESSDDYMKTYNVMRLGDIAFEGNKSKSYAHGRFVENTIGDGIVSHVFDVFRPIVSYDLNYWKYFINNENVMGRTMARCTKSSTMMTNLVANDFLKENVLVPAIEEQSKIGAYFANLDSLITLHQRELEILKNLKKTCLKRMFI